MGVISFSAYGDADDKMPAKLGSVEGINEYQLDNGLRVLLFEDNSQPKVTISCTVFVGSRHEGYGESGLAHLVEHMLFKGTEKHPQIPDALRDRGADYNGSTALDRTNYYETLTSSDENLEFAISLEADRILNGKLQAEDLQTEVTVVRSEYEMVESNPTSVLKQRMFSTAYQWHNYGNAIIGTPSDFEKAPIERLRSFYRKHYRPDNAMLVIAGSFDQTKALGLVQKYFGPMEKPKTPLPRTYTVEPPQDGDRVTTVRRVGDVPYVGVMYHIPAGCDPEYAAVQLLTFILTDEPSGRLYKSLIETKKASSIFGMAYGLHDPGVMQFMAQISKEQSLDDAKNTMLATLEELASAPITTEEVERVRQQFLNYREMMASKTDRLAISLSDWAAQGDWRLYFLHRDAIEKVTADQVQEVARKYLVRNNRTVGLYIPTSEADRIEIPDRPNVSKIAAGYIGREAISEGEQFDPTPKNIEGRLVRGELKTGIPFAFLPKKTRGETVNLSLKLRFGDEKSLMGKSAAVSILGSLMERGTKTLSLQQFNDRKDQLKAVVRIESHSSLQTLSVSVETRRSKLIEVLDLIEDVLRHPDLAENEFNILRDQVLTQFESQRNDPRGLATQAVSRSLNTHKRGDVRYVPTTEEEIDDYKKLKWAEVKDIHARFLSGTEGEVTIVGDCDPTEVEEKLSSILSSWKSKTAYQRIAATATTEVKIPVRKIETPDKANASYIASQQYAIRDDHPKYPALVMANTIFGGNSLSSRLGVRVRQDEGLSYGVYSRFGASPIDERASLSIIAMVNPTNCNKLMKVIDEELRRFVKDGITENELKDNVRGFLQNQRLSLARDGDLISILANNLFTGRNMDYYEKLDADILHLTVEDVNEAIREYISPDEFVIAIAGDFAKP